MNSDTAELRHLCQLASKGDNGAISNLYTQFKDEIYGATLHITHCHADSQDLTQNVFLKLLEQKEKMKEIEDPRLFLRVSATNLAKNLLRRKILTEKNAERLIRFISHSKETPQETVELKQMRSMLKDAVQQLPESLKRVFTLKHMDHLSHEQIALQLGISYESSKKYISRAYILLREYLLDHMDEGSLIVCILIVFVQGY